MSQAPQVNAVAASYSEALFRAARAQGALQRVQAECRSLATVLENSPRLATFLGNPMTPMDRKLELLKRALERRLNPLVMRLLMLMTRRDRVASLPETLDRFQKLVEHAEGIEQAEVVSAMEMGFQDKMRVKAALEKRLEARLRIDFRVDPGLIGGLVCRVRDTLMDGSLRSGLDRLAKRLRHVSLAGQAG
jgi:F-type H+-transporting ATPase subunit delta